MTTQIVKHNGGWTNYVHLGCSLCASLSNDGLRVVSSATHGQLLIRDKSTDDIIMRMNGHWNSVGCVTWAPKDTSVASTCSDGTARIWDPITGKELHRLVHPMGVISVEYRSDGGQLVTACWDGSIRVWDVSTGNKLQEVRVSDQPLGGMALSPDDTAIATVCDQGKIGLPSKLVLLRGTRMCAEELVKLPTSYRVRWSPDSRSVAITCETSVRIFSVDGDKLSPTDELPAPDQPTSLDWSPDGEKLCIGTEKGMILVIDLQSKTTEEQAQAHQDIIWSVQWHRTNGQLMTASADGTAAIWNATNLKEQSRLARFTRGISAVDASSDGKVIVSCSAEGHFCLWDVEHRRSIGEFAAHKNWIRAVQWTHEGDRFLTASQDGTIGIWDRTGARIGELIDFNVEGLWSALWTHNGKVAAVSYSGHLCIVDPLDPSSARAFKADSQWLRAIAWSSKGNFVVCGGMSGLIQKFDMPSITLAWRLDLKGGCCFDCAISPDDNVLAVALANGDIPLIDLRKGNILSTLRDHTSQVWSVRFSKDGSTLLSAGADGTVRTWPLKGESNIAPKVFQLPTSCISARFLNDGEILFGSAGAWTLDPRTAAETPGGITKTLTDSPVALLDGPAAQDLLGRKPLVEELAYFLHRTAQYSRDRSVPGAGPDGFVVHIGGRWGSGKTTLIHDLVQRIQRRSTYKTFSSSDKSSFDDLSFQSDELRQWHAVFFGAWNEVGQGPSWWSIAMKVRNSILKDKNIFGRFFFRVKERHFRYPNFLRDLLLIIVLVAAMFAALQYAQPGVVGVFHSNTGTKWFNDALNVVASLITIGIPLVTLLIFLVGKFKRVGRRWRWPQTPSDGTLETETDFSALPRQYLRWLRGQAGSDLLIVVDDLDRCPPQYVAETISAIHLMTRIDLVSEASSSATKKPVRSDEPTLAVLVLAERAWLEAAVEEPLRLQDSQLSGAYPGKSRGCEFLEKIFIASIELPRLSSLQRQSLVRKTVETGVLAGDGGSMRSLDLPPSAGRAQSAEIEDIRAKITKLEQPDEKNVADIMKQIISLDPANRDHMHLLLAQRMNRPEYLAAEEARLLEDYATYMDSTPRGVKRTLVNFWLNRAVAQISATNKVLDDQSIMLWTIITLRWPSLIDTMDQEQQFDKVKAMLGTDYQEFEKVARNANILQAREVLRP